MKAERSGDASSRQFGAKRERLLGALALRDMTLTPAMRTGWPASSRENCTFSEQPVDATVRPSDAKFLVPDVRPRSCIPIAFPHPLAIFPMNQSEPILICERWMVSR